MEIKNYKDLDDTIKSDDKSFQISMNGDPNNPVEFAGMTKNVINEMDK